MTTSSRTARPSMRAKLVFFSSPNKGLRFTLDAFGALRRRMPDLRLCVGNPGYKDCRGARASPGSNGSGSLPHARVLARGTHARCAPSVANFVIPETFGLVFAESRAVGTPVLTSDCGAASEVLDDPRQVLPVTLGAAGVRGAVAAARPALARRGRRASRTASGSLTATSNASRAGAHGARPQVGPDPRFRLSVIAARVARVAAT